MIKYDLNNRVAVVTGGAQGFGLAITERFIEAGAKVVIWDIDEGAAKEALDKVKSEHLSHQIVDVTNFEIVSKNLEEVEKKYGKIDIFVNNAGIAGMNTTVAEYPLDEWKKVMNLNLNSVFYCCKAVVPIMLKNDYWRIVNIASIAGKEGNPNASAYSTSKAGVIGLTKSLGKELAQKNIAVNCVTPAAAKTRIFDQMTEEHINYMLSKIPRNKFAKVEELAQKNIAVNCVTPAAAKTRIFDQMTEEHINYMLSKIPRNKFAQDEELASLVTWLASEENSFSTAAVFDLSGGRATY